MRKLGRFHPVMDSAKHPSLVSSHAACCLTIPSRARSLLLPESSSVSLTSRSRSHLAIAIAIAASSLFLHLQGASLPHRHRPPSPSPSPSPNCRFADLFLGRCSLFLGFIHRLGFGDWWRLRLRRAESIVQLRLHSGSITVAIDSLELPPHLVRASVSKIHSPPRVCRITVAETRGCLLAIWRRAG